MTIDDSTKVGGGCTLVNEIEEIEFFRDETKNKLGLNLRVLAKEFGVVEEDLLEATAKFLLECPPLLAEKSKRRDLDAVAGKIKAIHEALILDEDVEDYLAHFEPHIALAAQRLGDATREFVPAYAEAITNRHLVASFLLNLCADLGVEISSYAAGFLPKWLEIMNDYISTDFNPGAAFSADEMARLVMREGKKFDSFKKK